MPKKLSLRSIKSRDAVHPKSRKAQQMTRAFQRSAKISNQRLERERSTQHPIVDLLTWFQVRLEDEVQWCSREQVAELCREYLQRNFDEISELRVKVRSGRPTPPRIQLLEESAKREAAEFASAGLLIPDLQNSENVAKLRAWNGSYDGVQQIRVVRFTEPK